MVDHLADGSVGWKAVQTAVQTAASTVAPTAVLMAAQTVADLVVHSAGMSVDERAA